MEKKNYSLRKPGDTYISFKEVKGDLKIFRNTVMYEKELENGGVAGESSEKLLLHIDSEIYEPLKNWISSKNLKPKKIDYQDRTYLDKRKILRQLSIKDEIDDCLDIVTDEVFDCIMYNFRHSVYRSIKDRIGIDVDDLTFWHYIRTLLVDGFLSFEVIFKDDKPIDLKPIDPCSLVPVFRSSEGERKNDFDWVQFPDQPVMKRVLTKDQIIYIGYSKNVSEYHISYVEELKESYERLKMIESSVFFPTVDPSMRPNIEAVRWLYEAFQNVSRIPKLRPVQYKVGECAESDVIRYNKFIERIVKIFDTEFFDKINPLNK
jgi:hypothetical protein